MLSAGDEFGRTQRGNNNAYAQDNEITWLDWDRRDRALEAFASALGSLRKQATALRETGFLKGESAGPDLPPDVEWFDAGGRPLGEAQWNDPHTRRVAMILAAGEGERFRRLAVLVNGDRRQTVFTIAGRDWQAVAPSPGQELHIDEQAVATVPGRSIMILTEA